MTLEQIYILNRALDGKDIYSIPTFADLEMTEMSILLYKDTLIEKGILESYSSFTTQGIQLTKKISEFKKAEKYIKILDLVIGIIDDNKAVMLQINDKDYTFTLINSKDAVKQLASIYKFLSLDCNNETDGKSISSEELLQNYKFNSSNSFNLTTEQNKKITSEIYFSDDDNIFVYDCAGKMLYQKSSHSVKALLSERMAV